MRQILIDFARAQDAHKRVAIAGPILACRMLQISPENTANPVDLIDLDSALLTTSPVALTHVRPAWLSCAIFWRSGEHRDSAAVLEHLGTHRNSR